MISSRRKQADAVSFLSEPTEKLQPRIRIKYRIGYCRALRLNCDP